MWLIRLWMISLDLNNHCCLGRPTRRLPILMGSALSGWYETCLRGSEFGARKMCPANLARLSSNSWKSLYLLCGLIRECSLRGELIDPCICIAPVYIRRWQFKNSAQSPQVEGIQLFAQRLGQMYSFKAIACYSNLLLITASYIRSCHFLFVVRSFQNRDNLFHVRFVS